MTNTPNTNSQQPALSEAAQKVWTKPLLDVLELPSAEYGTAPTVSDRHGRHKSA